MKLRIGFIGSGNVATHLSHAMNTNGHDIVQIISQNVDNAQALASAFNCDFTDDVTLMDQTVDVYFICVSDNQIENVAQQLPASDCVVVHTCGSVGLQVIGIELGQTQACSIRYNPSRKNGNSMYKASRFLLEASNPETLNHTAYT